MIEIFPKDNLLDRIRLLYGNEIAEGVVELGFEKDGIRLTGYVGKPTITQPNRSHQLIFVNKRPIVNRMIGYAIYEAYGTLIPKGRFPVAFLFLEISPESIDVNVHPTKKEVRFGDDRFVQEVVREGILSALCVNPALSAMKGSSEARKGGVKETVSVAGDEPAGFVYTPAYRPQESWEVLERSLDTKTIQMNNSYIITEVEDGIEIMDQHAVHERILYEKIKRKTSESQGLLIPVTIELTVDEENILKKEIPFLKELGFNIEEFGSRTVIIDMVPAILDKVDIGVFIKDILSEIKELEKAVSHEEVKDGIIKTMACRAAVKQGDKLDALEMQRLIRDWRQAKLPYTCPHGRNAVIRMTKGELDKKFHRT